MSASTPMCHVMLGCKGVGLSNTVKEVMTASVLQVGHVCVNGTVHVSCSQHVLGVGEAVKYSSHSVSRYFHQAIAPPTNANISIGLVMLDSVLKHNSV